MLKYIKYVYGKGCALMKKFTAIFMAMIMAAMPVSSVKAAETETVTVETEETVATQTDAEIMGTEIEQQSTDELNYNNTYIDIGERAEYYTPAGDMPILHSSTIPESYDSRDYGYVTSVKDQGAYGTCWAFSALGAGESSMLAQGIIDDAEDIDLSEYHLSYFFYNYVIDPLENLKDDKNKAVVSNYLDVGGNNYYTMFALATWKGAADEADAPYEDASPSSTLSSDLAFDDVAHMQNTYIVSMQNMDDVKQLIMDYGAVSSSVYFDYFMFLNDETNAYYQNISTISDHAIMVVGWDDNYSVDNFLSDNDKPTNPGAWLIKNSWGEGIYDYVWVSYEDACLSQEDAFAFLFEKADNYDKNYQYDGSASASYWGIESGESFANVYTCEGEFVEKIEAVSIALADTNVNYSVQIYKNPTEDKPKSGTALLSSPQTGTTTYEGYYTIELNEDIYVNPGDTFSVVFSLSPVDTNQKYVYVYVDGDVDGDYIAFESYTQANQSYYISNTYGTKDIYALYGVLYDYCPRIKAFTNVTDMIPEEPETPEQPEVPEQGNVSTWIEANGTWYYYDSTGNLATGWGYINGNWYYFNSDGAMQTGWQYINGSWYYMNSSGAMLTGWQQINGTWYFFYTDGSMAAATWVGSYYVDASGAWVTGTNTNSYTEGWKMSSGLWWYQNADGSYPANAWKLVGGAWYYFDAAGWMKTGWVHDGTGWYYLNPSGAMATGWLNDGGIWYYLTGSGLMHTGWLYDNGSWYYMIGSGAMATSTVIDGYTIDANGVWVQ